MCFAVWRIVALVDQASAVGGAGRPARSPGPDIWFRVGRRRDRAGSRRTLPRSARHAQGSLERRSGLPRVRRCAGTGELVPLYEAPHANADESAAPEQGEDESGPRAADCVCDADCVDQGYQGG